MDDPPTHIWTRQMKVRDARFVHSCACGTNIFSSSLECQTRRRCIKEVYGCAQAQA